MEGRGVGQPSRGDEGKERRHLEGREARRRGRGSSPQRQGLQHEDRPQARLTRTKENEKQPVICPDICIHYSKNNPFMYLCYMTQKNTQVIEL